MKFKAKKITMVMNLFKLFISSSHFFCHSHALPFRSLWRRRENGNPDSITAGLNSRFHGNDRWRVRVRATIIFIGFFFVVFGGVGSFVSAASTDNASYVPLAPLPGTTNDEGAINLNTYVPGIFNLAIGIAGVLAVLMIVIGGVEYMTTDAIQGKSDGKARITNALTGLLLVLVSYILLYTINPKLTIFDLNAGQTISVDNSTNNIINEYTGSGAAIGNTEEQGKLTVSKDGVDYTANVTTTSYDLEGGGKSYKEVEVYTDNKNDTYTTTKTTDKDGNISTVWMVEHMNGGYDSLDKDGNVIPLNL